MPGFTLFLDCIMPVLVKFLLKFTFGLSVKPNLLVFKHPK